MIVSIPFTPQSTIADVDQIHYDEINQHILRETIRAFSDRGFSGDIEFTLARRQVMRSVCEVHHVTDRELKALIDQSIATYWPKMVGWVEMSGTVLQVSFHAGKITRVRNVDAPQGE